MHPESGTHACSASAPTARGPSPAAGSAGDAPGRSAAWPEWPRSPARAWLAAAAGLLCPCARGFRGASPAPAHRHRHIAARSRQSSVLTEIHLWRPCSGQEMPRIWKRRQRIPPGVARASASEAGWGERGAPSQAGAWCGTAARRGRAHAGTAGTARCTRAAWPAASHPPAQATAAPPPSGLTISQPGLTTIQPPTRARAQCRGADTAVTRVWHCCDTGVRERLRARHA
jgi:hypothetical protein